MSLSSIGDLAASFGLRRHLVDLKATLAREGEQVVTERHADPSRALRGQYAPLAVVEHGRSTIAAHTAAAIEAATHAAGTQARLQNLIRDAVDSSAQFLAVSAGATDGVVNSIASTADGTFASAISALNATVGGRSLFAGAETGRPAVLGAAAMLAELAAATAGADTPGALEEAVRAWFTEPGGGFESVGYLGSATALGPIPIGPDDRVVLPGSALSLEIRDVLSGLALAALVDRGTFAGDTVARADVLQRAGQQLAVAQVGLAGLAASVGAVESRIETVRSRNSAEAMALDLARQDILHVDPFEAGIRLEETRIRLEALFQVTARLSRLSLADYLR